MPIDIQAFRDAAALGGNITLQDEGQGEVLVRGGKGAWLKSALNIGTARTDNRATLAALRDAIANDPAFRPAANDARALLDGMSDSRPLKAEDVTRIIDDMQALSVRRVKESAYAVAMRCLNPTSMAANIQTACQELGVPTDAVPEKVRSAFVRTMGDTVARLVGDGADHHALVGLEQMLREKTGQLVQICGDIRQSEVRDATKNILLSQICEKGVMKSPETMRGYITLSENLEANAVLTKQFCDVGLPDSSLAKAVGDALQAEGLSDAPSQTCLQTLNDAVEAKLRKLAQPDILGPASRLTAEQIGQVRTDVIRQFTETLKAAKGLERASDAAHMTRAVLEQTFLMSPETVRLLVADADKFAPGEMFSCMGKGPVEIMQELSRLGGKLQTLFSEFPKKHCPEATDDRTFYMAMLSGLTLGRAGMTQAQLEKAEQFLHSSGVCALRQGLASDWGNALGASNLSLLGIVHVVVTEMMGQTEEDYRARMDLPEISLAEAPVDVRLAVEPGTELFKGRELFADAVPADLLADTKEARAEQVLYELQASIAAEMRRFIQPEPTDVTQIGKDLERNENVYVDGVRISTDRSGLPEGADARVELARGALDVFANMLFGRSMAELTQNEQRQAMSLAGICNQSVVTSLQASVLQTLLPEGSYSVQSDVQRSISLTSLPSGDVAVRVEMDFHPKMLGTYGGAVSLDNQKSRVEGVMTFTIKAEGFKQVADSFDAWMQSGGDVSQLAPDMKMPIADLRFDGAIEAVPQG